MNILIESPCSGAAPGWRRTVEQRVRLVLHRLQDQVQLARVTLRDVNGPRGGVDKQCQILLTTAGHGQLVVVSRAEHAQGALNRALQRAMHALTRAWQRRRRPMRQTGTS